MKGIKDSKTYSGVEKYLRKASPTILSCLGAVGVVTTSILAVKATPKAIRRIRNDSCVNHDGDPNAYTKMEAIQSAWICYIPAVAVGASTIICIFGANILNKRQQASISSAYALLNSSYQDYRDKLKELYGEEAHQKIVDSIMVEKAENTYVSACGLCDDMTLVFDERNPEDVRLFYDSFSKRYFESTVTQVLEAEYHLNRNWCLGASVYVNDFYNFLGIPTIPGGDELGWHWMYSDGLAWIDFDHHKTILEDGLEVYVIDFVYSPQLEMDED